MEGILRSLWCFVEVLSGYSCRSTPERLVLWSPWGSLGALLEPSWAILGSSWRLVGVLMRRSCDHSGAMSHFWNLTLLPLRPFARSQNWQIS